MEPKEVLKVNKNNRKIKLKYGEGSVRSIQGMTAATLKDTGNSVILKILNGYEQPEMLLVLDYSQLDFIRKLLNAWDEHFCNKPDGNKPCGNKPQDDKPQDIKEYL